MEVSDLASPHSRLSTQAPSFLKFLPWRRVSLQDPWKTADRSGGRAAPDMILFAYINPLYIPMQPPNNPRNNP